ncbi:E3 ubiquitin-protein ligase msl-2 [Bienertia sinuspersici]
MYSDSEVREMVDIAYENRLLDLYVVHGVDEIEVLNDLEEDGETEDDLDDLDVGEVEQQEVQDEVEEDDGADSSDDELRIAREKVKASEAKLIELTL